MKQSRFSIIVLGLLSLLLFSCASSSESTLELNPNHLIDVSKFRVDTLALHDNEEIEVLCASDKLFPTDDVNYYIQTVVVSLETGDTVNVLAVGMINNITESNRVSRFVSINNAITKVMVNTKNLDDAQKIDELAVPNFDKVYQNPAYISLKTSHFPSVIGMITVLETSK